MNKGNLQLIVLTFLFLINSFRGTSNNISVSNISLTGINNVEGFILVEFDISWDNSWRLNSSPSNWDAAWVFIKFSSNSGPFKHGTLNYVNGTASSDGHTEPAGSIITTPSDGKGIFIYRSSQGGGSNNWQDAQIRWNFAADGVSVNDFVEVRVFAIEMVQVLQGSFAAGSGGSAINEFTLTTINTSNATTAPSGSGSHGGQAGGYPTGSNAPLTSNYPNGFNAFYCMKYELSEEQYTSFFNSLTSAQQANNDITDASHKNTDGVHFRNTVSIIGGTATTLAPDRACNFLEPSEILAYLDWAALRPMSELEYEKACRGTALPVANEFAWGTTLIHSSTYTISNDGQPNATVDATTSAGTGNASYNTTTGPIDGPFRCGIFPASVNTADRAHTGGTFWGVMEMSGNLDEPAICLDCTTEARSYDGLHGDGELTTDGEANVNNWPSTAQNNWKYRGASWNANVFGLYVGYRGTTVPNEQFAALRGVRAAP